MSCDFSVSDVLIQHPVVALESRSATRAASRRAGGGWRDHAEENDVRDLGEPPNQELSDAVMGSQMREVEMLTKLCR